MAPVLFTIGHSTRPLPELVDMLRSNGVQLLVDVRTIPKSRTNPQFNQEALEQQLPQDHGINYKWMGKELGGLRKRNKDSDTNAGWDNASFRGYADYMQTEDFSKGLHELMQLASDPEVPVAIMCAEVVNFRCHRSLISDALVARGWEVQHITNPGKPPSPHKLTRFAVVEDDGHKITYPAYDHEASAAGKKRRGRASNELSSGGSKSKRAASSKRGRKQSTPD